MKTLKYSRQRESIKASLMSRHDHPTADALYASIREEFPNISLGTVYRNLSLLSDLGEIKKLASFGGADRFDGRVEPHCHFMCTECGCVIDLETEDMQDIMKRAGEHFNGIITDCSARFFGMCEDCMKKEKN